jgi:hypothetical protein
MSSTINKNDGTHGSRAVSCFLIFIGLAALGVSVFMNMRFGLGLSQDPTDRTTMAILHVLVDPAAAGLVVAGALMRRWGWKWEGFCFQAIALLLILYSMLSVYGFMSARIAQTQSHDAIVAMQKGQLDWTRNSSVNRELPKVERRLLRQEAKELTKEIRNSLSIIPDAQAASIATAIGVSVEKVQRALVMISSGIAQAMKFVCLLAGVMIWPRSTTRNNKTTTGGNNGDNEYNKPTLVHDNTKQVVTTAPPATEKPAVARTSTTPTPLSLGVVTTPTVLSLGVQQKWGLSDLEDYLRNSASGLSQRQIAKLSGWTQQGVSKAQRRLRERVERENRQRARAQRDINYRSMLGDAGSLYSPGNA